MPERLPRSFYARETLTVARELLGHAPRASRAQMVYRWDASWKGRHTKGPQRFGGALLHADGGPLERR